MDRGVWFLKKLRVPQVLWYVTLVETKQHKILKILNIENHETDTFEPWSEVFCEHLTLFYMGFNMNPPSLIVNIIFVLPIFHKRILHFLSIWSFLNEQMCEMKVGYISKWLHRNHLQGATQIEQTRDLLPSAGARVASRPLLQIVSNTYE